MVEFADFNHGPREISMTDTNMPLIELLQKHDVNDGLKTGHAAQNQASGGAASAMPRALAP